MNKKSDLDRLKEYLNLSRVDLAANMLVDYLDSVRGSKSLRPGGLVEISRNEDILGNVTVSNQSNFGLSIAVAKSPGDGAGAA